MIEFIHNIWWLDVFRTSVVHPQERFTSSMLEIWYVVFCVLFDTSSCYAVVGRTQFFLQLPITLDVPALTTSLLLRDPSGQRWNYI
jgi:hypothetical protein